MKRAKLGGRQVVQKQSAQGVGCSPPRMEKVRGIDCFEDVAAFS